MRIASITWARNEADILEAFVRYHCALIDTMIVIDHSSDDNSIVILKHLRDEGLPVEIGESVHLAHRQDAALTASMREIARRGYDWLLPLDADEFIKVAPEESLHDILGSLTQKEPLRVPWQTYVPTPGSAKESHPLKRMRHRRSVESPQYSKVFVPAALFSGGHVRLSYGNHHVFDASCLPLSPIPCATHPGIALAHFPVRSAAQLARKAFGGWLGHTLREEKSSDQVWHWKLFFDRCSEQEPISDEELQEMAMRYAADQDVECSLVEDPLPIPAEARCLRYSPQEVPPLRVLARSAERIAERLSVLGDS